MNLTFQRKKIFEYIAFMNKYTTTNFDKFCEGKKEFCEDTDVLFLYA